MNINIPSFKTDCKLFNEAYRVAVGDVVGNIINYKEGLLEKLAPCLIPGLDYHTAWTRDATINVANALFLLSPEVSKNTLISVLEQKNGNVFISGQYWDKIIWITGAYRYYEVTRDTDFLNRAFEATVNTMNELEKTEYNCENSLFYGAAVYGDGISAYPDKYAGRGKFSSCILDWDNEESLRKTGIQIPMIALSTNCVYYMAYVLLSKIAKIIGEESIVYEKKAQNLKNAINRHFWNSNKGNYGYLLNECDYTEGMGVSLAVLFGIADNEQIESVSKNTYISPHGIPCVWPSFNRYLSLNGYGRHSGTVWPHIQGMWALAMIKNGNTEHFEHELINMAEKARRDMQYSEIYHPETGEIYGGLQENMDILNLECGNPLVSPETLLQKYDKHKINLWYSLRKQTWSATAFLSLVYYGIMGISFKDGEIKINPYMPEYCNSVEINNIVINDEVYNFYMDRMGYKFEKN